MDVQMLGVILLIAGAAFYVLRTFWGSLKLSGKGGCGSGCGKCSSSAEPKSRSGMISLKQVRK